MNRCKNCRYFYSHVGCTAKKCWLGTTNNPCRFCVESIIDQDGHTDGCIREEPCVWPEMEELKRSEAT